MSQSEPGLIARAQGGDAGAFASLVEGRWDGLVRLARSVVGESEAEDAVQDGLLIAWRKLAALRDADAFAAWLTRLVLRTCLRPPSKACPTARSPRSSTSPRARCAPTGAGPGSGHSPAASRKLLARSGLHQIPASIALAREASTPRSGPRPSRDPGDPATR